MFEKNKKDINSASGAKKHAANKKHRVEQGPIIGDDFQIISTPQKPKKKKKSAWRTVGITLLSLFLIGIISFCLIFGAFLIYVFKFVDGTVDQDLNDLKLAYTSVIYATDPKTGEPVEVKKLHAEENRLWVDFDKIPYNVQKAYISAEDKRFETHDGVDWKRTFLAFVNMFVNVYDSQQGGSTITQQLVKNITNDDEVEHV